MQTTLVPDDLFDRQTAAVNGGVDAIVQMLDGQRQALAAAYQLSSLSVEALAHLTRSFVSMGLELTGRATTTSAKSVEQLSQRMALLEGDELAAPNGSRSTRKPKEAAAA